MAYFIFTVIYYHLDSNKYCCCIEQCGVMYLLSLLQLMLIRELNKDGRSRDLEDVLRAAAHDTDVEDVIHKGKPIINYNS